ncbi:MAG: hypothetical protein AB1346_00675 [Thermodesulfobacteriota bacterium]
MAEPPEEWTPKEPFRQWLNRQIGILAVVLLVVGASVYMDRQSQNQGVAPTAFIEEMQPSNPVETGAIPSMVMEEPWMREYGHD